MATQVGPGGATAKPLKAPPKNPPKDGKTPPPSKGGGGKTTPSPPPSTPAGSGLTPDQASASAALHAYFDQYGLGGLIDWAWQQYLNGTPVEQIYIDAQQRPEWKARFPAMEELARQGRAISPDAYIAWERQAVSIFQQYGLPKGFYDQPDDFTKFLVNGVDTPELAQRVQRAAQVAMQVPQEVRDELASYAGVSDSIGALTALWLDPDRATTALEQQFTAATIGAQSRITGFGALSRDQAMRLAELGVTGDTARQGFGQLGALGQVAGPALAGEQQITRQELLDAAFAGDVEAQRKITQRQEQRVAAFSGGGGYTVGQQRTGIGTQE